MDDAEGMAPLVSGFVSGVKSFRGIDDDSEDGGGEPRIAPLLRVDPGLEVREGRSLDELHREVIDSVDLADVEHRADI